MRQEIYAKMDCFAVAQAEMEHGMQEPEPMPTGRNLLDTLFQLEADTYTAYQNWKGTEGQVKDYFAKNVPLGNEYLFAAHMIEGQRLQAQSLAQRTGIALRFFYDVVDKLDVVNEAIIEEVEAVNTRLGQVQGMVESINNGCHAMQAQLNRMEQDISAIKVSMVSMQNEMTVMRQLLTLAVYGIGTALGQERTRTQHDVCMLGVEMGRDLGMPDQQIAGVLTRAGLPLPQVPPQ